MLRNTIVIGWTILTVIGITFMAGCDNNPMGGGPEPIPLPAYFAHPAWHPAGQWIAPAHPF